MPLECAQVRSFVTPGFLRPIALLAVAALPCLMWADIVRMKNGDVIYADRVTEHGNTVQYEIGDDAYSVPKSRVERIEMGAPAAVAKPEIPTYVPAGSAIENGDLLGQIVHEGAVNREALTAIESRGNSTLTAVAFYIAGKQEFQSGKYAEAGRDFETGIRYDPQNPAILNFYAVVLIRTGKPRDAVEYSERAVKLAPDSPDALAVLGSAQYSAGHSKEAVQNWKRSLALRPDDSIQHMVDRAEREVAAENNYSERDTGHFALRYEGAQSSEAWNTSSKVLHLSRQHAERRVLTGRR